MSARRSSFLEERWELGGKLCGRLLGHVVAAVARMPVSFEMARRPQRQHVAVELVQIIAQRAQDARRAA